MAREIQIILQCREHGGRFTKPPGRRGRNPVKCNPEEGWGCSAVETAIEKPKRRSKRPIEVMEDVPTVRGQKFIDEMKADPYKVSYPQSPATARKLPEGAQASKAARDKAEALLEGLGWTTSGKGWKEIDSYHASITANRGPETLYLEWRDGTNIENDYAIMDTVKPSNNKDMPAPNLPFDPEEVSDWQLVQMISGNKITWWNTLGSLSESAVCGNRILAEDGSTITPPRVAVEHVYNGDVGPLGVDRLIKFTDGNGGGIRLIKVGALLKVG